MKLFLLNVQSRVHRTKNTLVFTTGSPGGSRIISAVLQSILNIVDFGMNLEEATSATRVHHQWQPEYLMYESFEPELVKNLEQMGFNLFLRTPILLNIFPNNFATSVFPVPGGP